MSPARRCGPLQRLLLLAALTPFTLAISFRYGCLTVMQQADQPNTQLAIRNITGRGHFPLVLDVS